MLGEFPWQVRVGESAEVTDYVSPPRVLSSEQTGNEVTWSMGEYMSGKDVWKAFRLPGSAPDAVGVYENQPSPLSAETQKYLGGIRCVPGTCWCHDDRLRYGRAQ